MAAGVLPTFSEAGAKHLQVTSYVTRKTGPHGTAEMMRSRYSVAAYLTASVFLCVVFFCLLERGKFSCAVLPAVVA